jgi:hypothetical protein
MPVWSRAIRTVYKDGKGASQFRASQSKYARTDIFHESLSCNLYNFLQIDLYQIFLHINL